MSNFTVAQDNEVSVKELEKKGCSITLEITAKPSLINKCMQDALVQVQSRAQLQGFRTGKVPLNLVKQNFGRHIQERLADMVLRAASAKALEKSKLQAVMVPSVSKADFTSLEENKPFTFQLDVDTPPTFSVKGYTGIEVTKKSSAVSEDEVKKHIDQVLEHNSRLESEAEGAAVSDSNFAVVKYKGSKDGVEDKKYSAESELIDMSAPQSLDGLAEAVKGAKKGEVKEFETKMDDGTVKFTVTVEDVKKKVAPALDDVFAKDMGFETVEKMKEAVKTNLEKEALAASENDVVAQIENALLKANSFEIPQSLLDYHTQLAVDNFVQRMFGAQQMPEENKKAFAEKMRPNVERDLKIGYIINAIEKKENIQPTEQEFKAELDKTLEANPSQKDKINAFFAERKADIMATMGERKVFAFLKEKAKIK